MKRAFILAFALAALTLSVACGGRDASTFPSELPATPAPPPPPAGQAASCTGGAWSGYWKWTWDGTRWVSTWVWVWTSSCGTWAPS